MSGILWPEPVGQHAGGHDTPGAESEESKEHAKLTAADCHRPFGLIPDLKRPEKRYPQCPCPPSPYPSTKPFNAPRRQSLAR